MVTQVLFVQGGGRGAHEVDAKLVASLRREIGPGYQVRYPVMPNEASPDYAAWKRRLAEEVATLDGGGILVGHSLGASVLLKFLAESEPSHPVAGVFLIAAPFWGGDDGWQWKDVELPKDVAASFSERIPIFFYHGRDDREVPFAHVDLYAKVFPRAMVRRLSGRNHQLNDDLAEVASDIRLLVPESGRRA